MSRISFLTLIACLFNNCTSNEQLDKQNLPYFGRFKINIQKSELGIYEKDTAIYKHLNLEIKEAGGYSFNKEVPFINSKSGDWKIKNIDGINYLYLVYGKGIYDLIEDEVKISLEGDLYIINTRPRKNEKNVEKLVLTRMD